MNSDPTSLDRFHGPILPPPAPWWPLTPGWMILLGAVALILLGLMLIAIITWQANRYRRQALALLDQPSTTAPMIAVLLKRAALTIRPREEVADLTGHSWIAFLNQTEGSDAFSKPPADIIETIAFQPKASADSAALKTAARHWLRHHQWRGKP